MARTLVVKSRKWLASNHGCESKGITAGTAYAALPAPQTGTIQSILGPGKPVPDVQVPYSSTKGCCGKCESTRYGNNPGHGQISAADSPKQFYTAWTMFIEHKGCVVFNNH